MGVEIPYRDQRGKAATPIENAVSFAEIEGRVA
jgi:hypothetical protein